jgi:hypothetical protein
MTLTILVLLYLKVVEEQLLQHQKFHPSEMFPEFSENAVFKYLFPDNGAPSIERCIEENIPDILFDGFIAGTFFFICILFFFIALKKPGTF